MRLDQKLEGEQIYLRTCELTDVSEGYVGGMNKQNVNQYVETRYVEQTYETVKEYVDDNLSSEDELLLAIVVKNEDKHIGNVHLTFNRIHKRCFIAYMIFEDGYWGRGIATEAIKIATEWTFENSDIARMDGGLYSKNIGSLKAVLRAGYKEEGVREQYILMDDGTRDDEIMVGLLRQDYEKIYKR